jgi:NADPH-dependent ferric siderophore reductase
VAARPPPLSPGHAVATVVESRSLGAYFTRIVLDVPDVERLNLPNGADTAVGIYFGGKQSGPGRTYTVRRDDRRDARLVVDILMHGDGVGTAWASHAAEGDKVLLAHANSWYRPPPSTDWQLLVADMAGLPALARILDDPPPVPTTVLVEVADDDVLAYLPAQPDVTVVRSFDRTLPLRVSAYTTPVGAGYCWFAGEASDARAVRKHLRRELRWELRQLDVMGYWRQHSAAWDDQFALIGAGLYSVYTRALDDGKSAKDAMEQFDEALERAGL